MPLHQSADLAYTITFTHRQAFSATVNRTLPPVTLSYRRQDCRCISPPTCHIRLLLRTDKPSRIAANTLFTDCRISLRGKIAVASVRRPVIYDYFCTQTSLFRNREPPFTDCHTFLPAARLPLHQSADLAYTITFTHRQAFFATVNRPLPTVALLTGGKIAVASVRRPVIYDYFCA